MDMEDNKTKPEDIENLNGGDRASEEFKNEQTIVFFNKIKNKIDEFDDAVRPTTDTEDSGKNDPSEKINSKLIQFTNDLANAVKSIEQLENEVRRNKEDLEKTVNLRTESIEKSQSNMNMWVIGVLAVGVITAGGFFWEVKIEKANNTRIEEIAQKQENLDGDFGKLETRVEKYVDRFLDLQNQCKQ